MKVVKSLLCLKSESSGSEPDSVHFRPEHLTVIERFLTIELELCRFKKYIPVVLVCFDLSQQSWAQCGVNLILFYGQKIVPICTIFTPNSKLWGYTFCISENEQFSLVISLKIKYMEMWKLNYLNFKIWWQLNEGCVKFSGKIKRISSDHLPLLCYVMLSSMLLSIFLIVYIV